MTFGVRQFKRLIFSGVFAAMSACLAGFMESVVIGNLLGSEALGGMNLITPVLSATTFLCGLVSSGTGTCYSLAMGRSDPHRAHAFFTQGLWLALILGGGLSLILLVGSDPYLRFFGADPVTLGYASRYLAWYWPVPLLEVTMFLLLSLGYADGDARLCALAFGLLFLLDLLSSIVAIRLGMGIAGCALATVLAETVAILLLCVHFFRPQNSYRPVRHFSWQDALAIVKASFADASASLCAAVLLLFLGKFFVIRFGSGLLPILGVAVALWDLKELFEGAGLAAQPLVTVYHGEGNPKGVRAVMNAAMTAALTGGAVLMVACLLFPGTVAGLFGIEDAALLGSGRQAVRMMSTCFVPLAFAGLFNSYFMFVERSELSAFLTFATYLVLPVISVSVASLAGPSGVWTGLALGPSLGLAATALFLVVRCGRKAFPLVLDRTREARIRSFSLTLDAPSIVDVSRRVADELTAAGVKPGVVMRASLLTEEVLLVVRDRNDGHEICAEVTLDLNDGVRLTLRDDGMIFDITDADARISSLRSYLVASIMERQPGRLNLVTTGFNRNVFVF